MINLRGRNEPEPEKPKPIIEPKLFNQANKLLGGAGVSGYISMFPLQGLFSQIQLSGTYNLQDYYGTSTNG